MRQSETLSLMRENVAYKLQHGKAKEAVDMLEKLHKYVKFLVFYTEEMYRTCTLDKLSLFSQRYRSAFSVHLFGSGLMVGVLASTSRSRCSGESWPGALGCILGQDTLLSQCLFPSRSVGNPAMDWHPIQGE